MSSLSQTKTLGGVGSILTLLGIVPYAGTALVIVGWVLVLLAIRNISAAVRDRSIFNNAMIAAILAIIGAAVGGVVVGLNVFRLVNLSNIASATNTSISTSNMVGVIMGILAGLAIVWVLAVISSFFLWRSYKSIGARLNVGLFNTGGVIYFIGAILSIVLVGLVVAFVAQILLVVACFSLPEAVPATAGVSIPPPPSGPPARALRIS